MVYGVKLTKNGGWERGTRDTTTFLSRIFTFSRTRGIQGIQYWKGMDSELAYHAFCKFSLSNGWSDGRMAR